MCENVVIAFEKYKGNRGDLPGSRRGSAGDPRGIRAKIRGSGHFEVPGAGVLGGSCATNFPFYNIKKCYNIKKGNACGFRVNALVQHSRIVPANGCLEFYKGL